MVEEGLATPAQVDRIVNEADRRGRALRVMDLTGGSNLLTVHCQELMRLAPTGSEWFRAPAILTKQGTRPGTIRTTRSIRPPARIWPDESWIVSWPCCWRRTYVVVDRGTCGAARPELAHEKRARFKQGCSIWRNRWAPMRSHGCVNPTRREPGIRDSREHHRAPAGSLPPRRAGVS